MNNNKNYYNGSKKKNQCRYFRLGTCRHQDDSECNGLHLFCKNGDDCSFSNCKFLHTWDVGFEKTCKKSYFMCRYKSNCQFHQHPNQNYVYPEKNDNKDHSDNNNDDNDEKYHAKKSFQEEKKYKEERRETYHRDRNDCTFVTSHSHSQSKKEKQQQDGDNNENDDEIDDEQQEVIEKYHNLNNNNNQLKEEEENNNDYIRNCIKEILHEQMEELKIYFDQKFDQLCLKITEMEKNNDND